MARKKRIVVAMSGGVDSSVAACLLNKQGHEVVGMTMCFNLKDQLRRDPACCSQGAIEDSRRVCHKLGIRHYVVNMQRQLQEFVVQDFFQQYLRGLTPNPCVRCNEYLKLGALLKKAISIDAEQLATGHYAVIRQEGNRPGSRAYSLRKAKDSAKDQSYFLYRLQQGQLRYALFPLGGYTKQQVRALARKFGLAVADKKASQEICFIKNDDYRLFLKENISMKLKPGDIVDTAGNILGRHNGIAYYTVGQRQGLGIAKGYPLYVAGIDRLSNRVIVGRHDETMKRVLLVSKLSFISEPLKKTIEAHVKIRYNHKEEQAVIEPQGKKAQVTFLRAQFAITPGQAAVFYKGARVLGGGVIERVLG
jgi:tRNA-specific 2-thiouridylase